mmetsp:Transcript_3382/g.7682  ORF Transcript_3382/g.7682 Transcript_3382/m.7682 type:complete len:109 (+) Transcript_3382:372-698(+)
MAPLSPQVGAASRPVCKANLTQSTENGPTDSPFSTLPLLFFLDVLSMCLWKNFSLLEGKSETLGMCGVWRQGVFLCGDASKRVSLDVQQEAIVAIGLLGGPCFSFSVF